VVLMDENQNGNDVQMSNQSENESETQENNMPEQTQTSDVASEPLSQEQPSNESTKAEESVGSQPSLYRSFIAKLLSFFKRSDK